MSGNLVLKNLLYRPFERVIWEAIEVLASKTVLKIYYRLFSIYLAVENIAKSAAKDCGAELGAKSLSGIKDPFNLSISLFIKKKPGT